MKFKVIGILFLVLTSSVFAQVAKKPVAAKKPATTTKKVVAPAKKVTPSAAIEGIFAEFETSKGKILLQLEFQKTPVTVANFIALAEGTNTFVTEAKLQGKPFYNGLKFHRVIKDFMIQGGDPLGNGSGNPGYKFKDEITELKHDKSGILSMANSGPGTNGSQFFITHKETPWLDGKHTVFGHVVTGMDVVNAIVQDDVIIKVVITRNGAAAKAFNAPKVFSDYYSNKAEDDKKQAALDAEKRKLDEEKRQKQALLDAEAKKLYTQKMAPVMAETVAKFAKLRKTATKSATGLEYVIEKGNGVKPAEGTTIYVHYAGYFEDGSIFDSSYEEVNKKYEKFDQGRADQNGYQPFPFQCGSKTGLITGFIEGLNQMGIGDKAVLFIPANLAWGATGSGSVIPPNANVIFEVELLDKLPTK